MAKAITALARPSQYVHMSMCSFTTGLPFYASGVFGGTFENWLYATFASRRVSMAKELRKREKAGKMSLRPEPQEEPQVSACGRQAHTSSQRARPDSLRPRSGQAG